MVLPEQTKKDFQLEVRRVYRDSDKSSASFAVIKYVGNSIVVYDFFSDIDDLLGFHGVEGSCEISVFKRDFFPMKLIYEDGEV